MRYTKIHTQIWNDEKFTRLTPSQQRLFLYILTSPHSNIVGFYVLKSTYIQGDLEVLPKDLAKDLAKLCHEGLISYDENLQVVLIHNWLKHNPITNPNQRLAAKKILGELPKTELFKEFKVLCEVLTEAMSPRRRRRRRNRTPPRRASGSPSARLQKRKHPIRRHPGSIQRNFNRPPNLQGHNRQTPKGNQGQVAHRRAHCDHRLVAG